MALVSLWLPIIVTLLALAYLFLLGRFVPGLRDDMLAIIIIVLAWAVWLVGNLAESLLAKLFGSVTTLIITLTAVVIVILLVLRFRGRK